jgi:hypothetical protein
MASSKKRPKGQWIDDLWNAAGEQFVRVETAGGTERSGKLSGIRTRTIKFNGEDQEIPIELELNGDPTDTVPLNVLVKIDLGT